MAQVSERQITVWTCSQNPYVVQRQLAGIFKVPMADVRVIVFTLGGGFGGKLNCKLEPVAAMLAKKTGQTGEDRGAARREFSPRRTA